MMLSEQLRAAQVRQHRRLGQLCRSAHADIRAMAEKARWDLGVYEFNDPFKIGLSLPPPMYEPVNHGWKLAAPMFRVAADTDKYPIFITEWGPA